MKSAILLVTLLTTTACHPTANTGSNGSSSGSMPASSSSTGSSSGAGGGSSAGQSGTTGGSSAGSGQQHPTVLATSPSDATVDVNVGSSITITFSQDMDADSTVAAVSFSPAISCTQAGVSGAVYTCQPATLEFATIYAVSIATTALSATREMLAANDSFRFTTAASGTPTVGALSITQFRQGAGAVSTTITGTGLGALTSVSVDTESATVEPGATDTSATVDFFVAHGAAIRSLNLNLANATGNTTVTSALAITAISVAPGGNDSAAGTTASPFSTLTHALSVAMSGDTVKLADGTYGPNETWPSGDLPSTTNVPIGVSVYGTTTAGTILTGNTGQTALSLAGSADIEKLTIENFDRAITATQSGIATVAYVHAAHNAIDGLRAVGAAHIEVAWSELDHNLAAGLSGDQNARLDSSNNAVHDNGIGIYAVGNVILNTGTDDIFHNGSADNATNSGVYLRDTATASIGSVVRFNYVDGVHTESSAPLALTSLTAYANGYDAAGAARNAIGYFEGNGVTIASSAVVNMSGGIFNDNAGSGLYWASGRATITAAGGSYYNNHVCGIDLDADSGANPAGSDNAASFTSVSLHDNQACGVSWQQNIRSLSVAASSLYGNGLNGGGADISCNSSNDNNGFLDDHVGSPTAPYVPASPGTSIAIADNCATTGTMECFWKVYAGHINFANDGN